MVAIVRWRMALVTRRLPGGGGRGTERERDSLQLRQLLRVGRWDRELVVCSLVGYMQTPALR